MEKLFRILRLPNASFSGIRVQEEGQVGSWGNCQQQLNEPPRQPMVKRQIRELVVDVSVENYDVSRLVANRSRYNLEFNNIDQIQTASEQRQIPGVYVLVPSPYGWIGTPDAAISMKNAVAHEFSQPSECRNVSPECDSGHVQTDLTQSFREMMDLGALPRSIDS